MENETERVFPRILVISHTPFNKSDSNGRTLGNLLIKFPIENISQFYIQNTYPDFSFSSNHYRITDSDILKSWKKTCCGTKIDKEYSHTVFSQNCDTSRKKKKTALKMLLRNQLWMTYYWWNKGFSNWLEHISPEVVIVQTGNAPFLLKIASRIAREYNSEIVIFNTEGYYFKKYNYIEKKQRSTIAYSIYSRLFRKEYENLMNKATISVYNCEKLAKDYLSVAPHNYKIIYCSSAEKKLNYGTSSVLNHFLYAGNLGVGRIDTLIKVANALGEISDEYYIDVYSPCDDEAINRLSECRNILYKGYVSYEKVLEQMMSCEYVLHIESFEKYYIEDSKYAFSTKIADALAFSNYFLVVAPDNTASSEYLIQNDCAIVVTDLTELSGKLKMVLLDKKENKRKQQNARKIVEDNHNINKNADIFRVLICRGDQMRKTML